MKWVPAIWTVAVLALVSGCSQGPTAGLDPFGRTTMPPPATRAAQLPFVAPSQVDPYYSGTISTAPLVPVGPRTSSNSAIPSSATPSFTTPSYTTPSYTTPSFSKPSLAPAGFATAGSPADAWRPSAGTASTGRLQPVSPSFLARDPTRTPTRAVSVVNDSGNVRRAAFVEEADQLSWREPGSTAPASIASATPAARPRVDIAGLPQAATTQGSTSILRTAQGAPAGAAAAPVSRYGFSHDYRWLKGQLAYSAPQRQWKLHYIPTNGQPDRFGGSVVLDSVSELGQYRHGDFIQVQGAVSATNPTAPSATSYRISRIARLQ